jgi:hypothetical protein
MCFWACKSGAALNNSQQLLARERAVEIFSQDNAVLLKSPEGAGINEEELLEVYNAKQGSKH